MSIKARIQGQNGKIASVNEVGAIKTYVDQPLIPPEGTVNRCRYFQHKLTDMNVDGSTTAQTFALDAASDSDIRVLKVTIIIADSSVSHNSFGGVSALGTGWDLLVNEQGNVTPLIDKAKTGGQVIAQAGHPGVGNDSNDWRIRNWTGTEDATYLTIDVGALVPGGIRIGRNSKDRIYSVVNDDLTGLTEFTVYLSGHKLFEV